MSNTSPSPWMSRVAGKRKYTRAAAPQTEPEPVRLVDLSPEERRGLIRMPYLRFLDPAHQRVKKP
jgi:hypothetical protein